MEEGNIKTVEGLEELPPPAYSVVAVAISGSRKTKHVVSWALDKFVPEGLLYFKLLHVRSVISRIPTPMGNFIPISQVREDVAAAFRKEVECQTTQKLLPYRKMCTQRKVQVEIVQIESDDVVAAISGDILTHRINKLVIGSSSRSIFSSSLSKITGTGHLWWVMDNVIKAKEYSNLRDHRAIVYPFVEHQKGANWISGAKSIFLNTPAIVVVCDYLLIICHRARTQSSIISESCPSFCTVYAISKGKLSSLRPSDSETIQSFRDDSSDTSSIDNSSSNISSSQTDWTDQGSHSHSHIRSASLPAQRFQALSSMNQTLLHKRVPSTGIMDPGDLRLDAKSSDGTDMFPSGLDTNDETGQDSSFTSSVKEYALYHQASTSETSTRDQADINFELEKLRMELRHIRGMYAMAQGEAIDASRKLNELQKLRQEEEINLKQISLKEEEAKELAKKERKRYEDAKREAELVNDCVKREASERQEAEIRASRKTKEKENLESILNGQFYQYRQFTWEEIVSATSSFSEDLKIGMGAYGTVYKCSFQHTSAAVKVLHAKEGSRIEQFQQELDILSKIRHPHLLILLGACAERNCLVYEFMENGSLEDRLFRRNNTPPLLWFDRVQIAWEVASALIFLHNSKPKAIIHRDLKPANILLDRNYVSKIGDVGLSTMVSDDPFQSSVAYTDLSPVGTLCYIDPEYQRTGEVSPTSDVYAFGMVILQLLTAKPAIALAHKVEKAVGENRLMEMLDTEAGAWPIEEAKDLALLALKCTELRRRDRPDLQHEVLPALEKLKDAAERARSMVLVSLPPPPKHYTCPILREAMADPCVAADGYTYDRKAIEAWLQEHDTSPVTELPLPHKHLIPNHALLSAIMEWRSGK